MKYFYWIDIEPGYEMEEETFEVVGKLGDNLLVRRHNDWPDISGALQKVSEELEEFKVAYQELDRIGMEEELGDLIFSAVNVARFAKLDPEEALKAATDKFTDRFCRLEDSARAEGRELAGMTLEEMDALWDKIKAEALKKYPKYVQIKTVKINIRNSYGVLKKEHEGYFNISPEGMSFIDYVNRSDVSLTSNAYVSNTYSRYYGQSLDATFNFDNHIIFMDDGDRRRNATDEEMDRYLEISLKHEMGHIVHYCDLIYNNPTEVYEYIRKTLGVIDDRAVKEYDDTPEDQRLDYTYWYYTLRPFERIANELMDISIEDMYKADMVEIPDSIKELIKKD